ncbi:hypothetical protein HWV62_27227 [Athelia sp. TMB]|nr:hypothetical protein HWV62_27227 [Athelia sp. TMB]
METLQFNSDYWRQKIPGMQNYDIKTKLHLILSLVIFLSISIQCLLEYIFSTNIMAVKSRASLFMSHKPSANTLDGQFYPSMIYRLWHTLWPNVPGQLHKMIQLCAHKIVLGESNAIIKDSMFQIRIQRLTMQAENTGKESDSEDKKDWGKGYSGFSQDPVFHALRASVPESTGNIVKNIQNRETMFLAQDFAQNIDENIISGTSLRVMKMLSNVGICVSNQTIERLKTCISEGAIQLAVELITSGQLFFVIFDNISIFLCKSQQQLTNLNTMIHTTNLAITALPSISVTAEDLTAKHVLRGERVMGTNEDISPTPQDDVILANEFQALIADMLVHYAPRKPVSQWENMKVMKAEVAGMMLEDCPLKVEITNVCLAGIETTTLMAWRGSIMLRRTVHYMASHTTG